VRKSKRSSALAWNCPSTLTVVVLTVPAADFGAVAAEAAAAGAVEDAVAVAEGAAGEGWPPTGVDAPLAAGEPPASRRRSFP
jgi:hypothetical protein